MSQTNRETRLTDWDFGNVTEDTNDYRIPFYHGALYESCRLTPRDLFFTGYTYGKNKIKISQALCPLTKTRLNINNKIYAYGKVIDTPKFSKYRRGFFSFTFRMFEPFFYTAERTFTLQENESGTAYNMGDVETPLNITLFSKELTVVSDPYIKNLSTNQSISLKYVLPTGAKIIIDTSVDKKTIQIVKSDGALNGLGYLNFESELFLLRTGENVITSNCRAEIRFKNKFLEFLL